MDILIKNMEMPKDEGLFIVICSNGTIEKKIGRAENGYPIYHIVKEAKAVALPEHGRLGELDKIAKRFHGFYEKHLENGSYETAEIWKYAEQEVRLQGTIVEATE